MKNHAQEVKNLLTDARQLCSALGWMAGAKPNGSGLAIRCPAHPDKNPSCGVTKGEDGTLRAVCFTCQWSADALGMIAFHDGLSTTSSDDFRDIMAHGAEIGGDLMLADEIRQGRPVPDREHVPAPPVEPPREYPDQSEVLYVWAQAKPPAFDAGALALLGSRSIDANAAAERALLRAFGPGQPLPQWATFGNAPWGISGHRLIARVLDADGAVRSLRAWQVDGKFGPKRVPPTGHKMAGLVLANREAAKILAGKSTADSVVICEGEPDWVTWATRAPVSVAVFGIGSGGWTKEHAAKLPKSCCVYVRTHCDEAGDKYAAHVVETIGERCAVWRLNGTRGIDENDRARDGTLPQNPADSCEPANDSARKVEENRPRVFTVREMMQVAHKALATNEPPLMWTSGHWKIDMMTGGLRPDSGWVIGAASNWGKSMFLISMCDENMRSQTNQTVPLIVSGEDSEELYAQRLLARRARVNAMRLRDNCLKPDEHKRIAEVMSKSETRPHYLDGRGVNFEKLLHQILELVAKHSIRIVALDYVQEFRTKKNYESERVMFREIARTYRHALKREKCGSLLLTQVTAPEKGNAPNKDNIRECKDIGHGAEVIGMGWEPQENVTVNGEVIFEAKSKLMLLDKTKSGSKGAIKMDWDPVSACFNKIIRPMGYSDDDTVRYDADADTMHSMCTRDEYDDAIGAYDQFADAF